MSSKQFNLLGLVTLVLVVTSILLASWTRTVEIGFVRGQQLMQYFDPARLSSVELIKDGDEVVLQRRGAEFLVASRNSYPANTSKLNELIHKCLAIRCSRPISESADTHAEQEVSGEKALTVRFMEGDKEIVGVVIGKTDGQGNFVRLNSESTVYVTDKSVSLNTDDLDYIDRLLTEIEQDTIKTVEVSGTGQPYVLAKGADGPKLEGIPEGMTTKSSDYRTVFSAACNLNFSDFKSEADVKDVEFKNTYTVTTEAGAKYKFLFGKKDDKWFCKTAAEYVGPASLTSQDDPEALKKQEAILKANTAVTRFVQQHQSWVYEMESWSSENMTKAFDDLIEEDKAFLKVQEKSIAKVEVSNGGETYTIESPEDGKVNLMSVPSDKQPKGIDHQMVFSVSPTLSWTERKKPDDDALKDLKFDSTYKVVLRNNAQFTFEIAKKSGDEGSDKPYIKASAAYLSGGDETRPEAAIAKGAVAKFNERHKGHVYEMSAYSVDNMIRKFADLLMEKEKRPEQIGASHIRISWEGAEKSEAKRSKEEAKTLANEVLGKVMSDPDKFAELAKEHSNDDSAGNGGDLGQITFELMATPFSEAAFKLKVGEVSAVVETSSGYHIIKRTK